MTQTLLTALLVTAAFLWIVWKLFLPESLRLRLRGGSSGKKPGCGSGSCSGCCGSSHSPQ